VPSGIQSSSPLSLLHSTLVLSLYPMAIPTNNFHNLFYQCMIEEPHRPELSLDLKVLARMLPYVLFDHEPVTRLCTIKLNSLSYSDGKNYIYHLGYNYANSFPPSFGNSLVKGCAIVLPGDYVDDAISETCQLFYSRPLPRRTFDTWLSFGTLGWGFCDQDKLETKDFNGLGALEIQFELIRNLFATLTFDRSTMKKGPLVGVRSYTAHFGSRSSIEAKELFFDALWLRLRAALLENRHKLFADWSHLLNEVPDLRA